MSYQTYTTLKRGYTHPIFCEDFLFTHQLGERYQIMAVMDGSTMGTTSFFASTLVAKLLKKTCVQIAYQLDFQLNTPNKLGKALMKQLFAELSQARSQLFLGQDELYTTLLLTVLDKPQQKAWVLAIGDGIITVNEQCNVLDHHNQPDYVAYHLQENFDDWWANHSQIWEFEKVKNLALATDGLLAIESNNSELLPSFMQPLLIEGLDQANPHSLDQKLGKLLHQHQAQLQDDLAIVRATLL